MALRPELEAKVSQAEQVARRARDSAEILIDQLDDVLEELVEDPVPAEVWDDISVVNHVAELSTEARRVRRESGLPPIDTTKERKP